MTADTDRATQAIFARLIREHPALTDTDRRLMNAFERLMLGRPEITDGSATVTNICTEAGVSRASYYRSPVATAVKEILEAPQTRRPELDELKGEIKQLRQAERRLRSDHAGEIRELRDMAATYANQIQLLTIANAELTDENERLRGRLATTAADVIPLSGRTHEHREQQQRLV
jgi:hypothetical protein